MTDNGEFMFWHDHSQCFGPSRKPWPWEQGGGSCEECGAKISEGIIMLARLQQLNFEPDDEGWDANEYLAHTS